MSTPLYDFPYDVIPTHEQVGQLADATGQRVRELTTKILEKIATVKQVDEPKDRVEFSMTLQSLWREMTENIMVSVFSMVSPFHLLA